MFATKEFIETSRNFVCVRLETYESEETQKLVRSLLKGKLANTTFVIFAPDGQTQLSEASRSPIMSFTPRGTKHDITSAKNTLKAIQKIAAQYKSSAPTSKAIVPDFHSFKQALNVSSADQRLLILTVAPEAQRDSLRQKLQAVANDSSLRGKFHYDMAANSDKDWATNISGVNATTGHFIIYPGQFGLKGKILACLKLNSSPELIKATLLKNNTYYKSKEKPKHYAEHIQQARNQGISYKSNLINKEDIDADGMPDPPRNRR